MKITISNDDGEVYAVVTDAALDFRGRIVVRDNEGEDASLDDLVRDAIVWDKNTRPSMQDAPLEESSIGATIEIARSLDRVTTNDAAERLRELAANSQVSDLNIIRSASVGELRAALAAERLAAEQEVMADCTENLAAERRATVERIRAAINGGPASHDMGTFHARILAILDAEAER